MAILTEKDIDHLAELSRIEVSEVEKKTLLKDLEGILKYVKELQSVDTKGVEPMTGGTARKNEFRADDDPHTRVPTPAEELQDVFPEREGRHLKVPHVFD
ncbi:MAG: Asp-tRNA(Asn)/Glu-tRNA(Gln) amidotransferase subunit GatC [Candidatus Wolfebacteria bacterium]|nr:Asp-tRNA(Asn)/Glu-tRNA(Gln) amidotransferase subunit GatC [Candidatus Wolfebacteria bacterium]MDP2704050.1 Asp-tRNA(Asn)/Glu-tRNA(Gln) amidotransferase subunit GatC [bacterium]